MSVSIAATYKFAGWTSTINSKKNNLVLPLDLNFYILRKGLWCKLWNSKITSFFLQLFLFFTSIHHKRTKAIESQLSKRCKIQLYNKSKMQVAITGNGALLLDNKCSWKLNGWSTNVTYVLAKNAIHGNLGSWVSTKTFCTKTLGSQLCCNTRDIRVTGMLQYKTFLFTYIKPRLMI